MHGARLEIQSETAVCLRASRIAKAFPIRLASVAKVSCLDTQQFRVINV